MQLHWPASARLTYARLDEQNRFRRSFTDGGQLRIAPIQRHIVDLRGPSLNLDPKRPAQNAAGSAARPERPVDEDEPLLARAELSRAPGNRESDFEEDEAFHPLAILLGVLMVLLLVVGAWYLFKQARCNPLYSDSGLSRSQSCR